MAITKQIKLKPETTDAEYTKICNLLERQGVFVSCGNTDDKWVLVRFADELSFMAWCVAMGMASMKEAGPGVSSSRHQEDDQGVPHEIP